MQYLGCDYTKIFIPCLKFKHNFSVQILSAPSTFWDTILRYRMYLTQMHGIQMGTVVCKHICFIQVN